MQRARIVVKTEEQRPDHRSPAVLVPAKASDYAVGRARVLHLDHRSLAGAVWRVESLGHHAVEPCAFEALEPILSKRAVTRRGRKMNGSARSGKHLFEPLPPLLERRLAQVLIPEREQVP